jgi:hypothetical protein
MILGHDRVSTWFGLIGMIIWFTFVGWNHVARYRIIPKVENTQIPIFEFECLWSGSKYFGCDASE